MRNDRREHIENLDPDAERSVPGMDAGSTLPPRDVAAEAVQRLPAEEHARTSHELLPSLRGVPD